MWKTHDQSSKVINIIAQVIHQLKFIYNIQYMNQGHNIMTTEGEVNNTD